MTRHNSETDVRSDAGHSGASSPPPGTPPPPGQPLGGPQGPPDPHDAHVLQQHFQHFSFNQPTHHGSSSDVSPGHGSPAGYESDASGVSPGHVTPERQPRVFPPPPPVEDMEDRAVGLRNPQGAGPVMSDEEKRRQAELKKDWPDSQQAHDMRPYGSGSSGSSGASSPERPPGWKGKEPDYGSRE